MSDDITTYETKRENDERLGDLAKAMRMLGYEAIPCAQYEALMAAKEMILSAFSGPPMPSHGQCVCVDCEGRRVAAALRAADRGEREVKQWSWQVLYILMPHEPIVQRVHWFSYVVLPQ